MWVKDFSAERTRRCIYVDNSEVTTFKRSRKLLQVNLREFLYIYYCFSKNNQLSIFLKYPLLSRYIRISPDRFDHLLGLVTPLIAKKDTIFRKAILACERLALTLRFLLRESLRYRFHFNSKLAEQLFQKFWSIQPRSAKFYPRGTCMHHQL